MAGRNPKVVIVGPAYIDMAVRCESFPSQGDTVEGSGFSCAPAGSGLNRAVQCALCDCESHLVSKVGDDSLGEMIIENLRSRSVGSEFVYTAQAISTGVMVTIVDSIGKNTSFYCAGTNKALNPDEINYAAAEQLLSSADVCMICGNLPLDTIKSAIRTAKLYNTRVILEASLKIDESGSMDGINCPKEYYLVDVFVPDVKTGINLIDIGAGEVHKLKMIGSELVAGGIECVVIKLGARGAFVVDRRQTLEVPGFEVDIVDKSACGDAFSGALAASVGAGDDMERAVNFANAAGAVACTRFGLQESLPAKQDILQLLMNRPD